MNIAGLNKADVLTALYNGQEQNISHYPKEPMTRERAGEIIAKVIAERGPTDLRFNYVQGRIIHMDLSGDEVSTRGYNLFLGEGAAERIVDALRASQVSVLTVRAATETVASTVPEEKIESPAHTLEALPLKA